MCTVVSSEGKEVIEQTRVVTDLNNIAKQLKIMGQVLQMFQFCYFHLSKML